MKDVAALAGVGLSTVSRVVSGHGPVSADKIAAVERAIHELDFRRNDFARNLRTGTSETIGVVVTQISDPYYSTMVGSIEAVAQQRNVLALLASATDDPSEAERVMKRLLSRRLDGLVVVLPESTDASFLQREMDEGIPLVFVDRPPTNLVGDNVVVDNRAGMVAAVRHLALHGHRRIGCLAHVVGSFTSSERVAGYYEGMRAVGLEPDPRLVTVVADTAAECEAAVAAMDALPEPPTALIATNSRTTKAFLAATIGAPPRGFIGFDDFDTAAVVSPSLTTIAQDPAAVGRAAAELLFQRIDGLDGPVRSVMLGTHLVHRTSGDLKP